MKLISFIVFALVGLNSASAQDLIQFEETRLFCQKSSKNKLVLVPEFGEPEARSFSRTSKELSLQAKNISVTITNLKNKLRQQNRAERAKTSRRIATAQENLLLVRRTGRFVEGCRNGRV